MPGLSDRLLTEGGIVRSLRRLRVIFHSEICEGWFLLSRSGPPSNSSTMVSVYHTNSVNSPFSFQFTEKSSDKYFVATVFEEFSSDKRTLIVETAGRRSCGRTEHFSTPSLLVSRLFTCSPQGVRPTHKLANKKRRYVGVIPIIFA
jgi:hypothetical protein